MPQLLSMEKQEAQLLKKKIDVQSRFLWNRVNYEDKLFMLLPMQAKQFEVSAAKNCAILSEAKKWQAN